MRFLQLLLGSDARLRPRLIAWMLAASLSTMAAIALISEMVGQGAGQPVRLQQLGLFLFISALIVFSQYSALNLTTELVERTLDRLQGELAGVFRRADLAAVERIGTARIYGVLSRTTTVLGEAGAPAIHGLITGGVMICLGAYVLYLSPFAFIVMVMLAVGTVYLFRHYMRPAEDEQQRAREAEQRYMELFVQLLDGFKEIKLNWRRGDDLQRGFMAAASAETRRRKHDAMKRANRAYSVGFAGFYLLLATVVFALPQYFSSHESATKITYVTIFLLATVNVLMRALPMLARANAALGELDRLEDQLAAEGVDAVDAEHAWPRRFDELRLHGIVHGDEGPFDLNLRPGELVVVRGPNGSGKTALLRLLTGLYVSTHGHVEWDGRRVEAADLPGYRALFAAVFEDSHVFDRPYGLDDDARARLPGLLRELGIDEAASQRPPHQIAPASSALRRRVALAMALLDARPVLILDDTLAGQDAGFVAYFRDHLLPALRARNVCVVIATADDTLLRDEADREVRPGRQLPLTIE
ncbi:MAG: ATP-binding cassette domain-containing protein [Azoarcus sp.]|nr:ATP-binding cassette domain-containing protein [Azoarcus sp.]